MAIKTSNFVWLIFLIGTFATQDGIQTTQQSCDFFLLHLNENKQPVHMRYHLFLQYGFFLQNLGKDFIRTNMHTTVHPILVCSNGIPLKIFVPEIKVLPFIKFIKYLQVQTNFFFVEVETL